MARSKRTDLHAQENLYRPVLELRSSTFLILAALFMLYTGYESDGLNIAPILYVLAGMLVLLGIFRVLTSVPYIKAHWRIFKREFQFVANVSLRAINHSEIFSDDRKYRLKAESAKKDNKSLPERRTYLCDGYRWGPEHAERAYQVANLSSDLREIALPFALNPITRHFDALARKMGGNNAVFGVDKRNPIFVTEDNWFGHTLITGNVGTGKTVLLRLLSASMLHLGHVVVVLDPKNDRDWKDGLIQECESLGIPFYHFHPGLPSHSVAYDVFSSYVNVSDLTSRLLSLISVPDEVNPFVSFAKGLISSIIAALKLTNGKPSILGIYKSIQSQPAIASLAVKCMESVFASYYGADKWIDIVRYDAGDALDKRFKKLREWYVVHLMNYDGDEKIQGLDVIPEMIEFATWDPEHFKKMTGSLMPLFRQLTMSPLDELLSPTAVRDTTRPVINSSGMFSNGGVLYMSLDGLSDPESAKYLAQLITSDITATAGKRYNDTDMDLSKHSRVSLFVDESHTAINSSMINLLAQGRAAKVALFISTQTISDYIAATDAETANRITGLCNNYISLRVNDAITQTLVADNFGKSPINTNQVTYTTGTGTDVPHNNFSGTISERKSTSMEESIPKEQLGQVPNLHIVARLQDGRKIVGQIPITVPEADMKPTTSLSQMLFNKPSKIIVRRNINVNEIERYKRKTA